jgi:hypothetical protein
VTETAANQQAAAAGRARETRALANENYGRREAPGIMAERRDAITLRCIAAIALRVNPQANAEPLGSV